MNIDWKKMNGLVPAIAQDYRTGDVLMLAYMSPESLRMTLDKGLATYWSRERQKMWTKGETSGNFQEVVEILYDCDCDSILMKVEQNGPACHTGNRSCFYRSVFRKIGGEQNG